MTLKKKVCKDVLNGENIRSELNLQGHRLEHLLAVLFDQKHSNAMDSFI